MEAAYENLKKERQNNVDNLIQWMKQSKVIGGSSESESKLRKLFDDARDKQDVDYAKFQDVVAKTAAEKNKTADQVFKMMTDALPNLQGAMTAAANAFQNAFK